MVLASTALSRLTTPVALASSCLLTPSASCTCVYYLILLSPPVQELGNPCWRGQLSIYYSPATRYARYEIEETLISLEYRY